MDSGESSSAKLTSVTIPVTGAMTSETALTDSTSGKGSPAVILSHSPKIIYNKTEMKLNYFANCPAKKTTILTSIFG